MAISKIGTNSLGNVTDVSSSTTLSLKTAGTTAVTVDASQNVGIGTASPSGKLQISNSNSSVYLGLNLENTTASGSTPGVKIAWTQGGSVKSSIIANTYGNDYMSFNVSSDTERMRIDSSGNLLVGTTTNDPIAANVNGVVILSNGRMRIHDTAATTPLLVGRNGAGSSVSFYYRSGATTSVVGTISITASATTYGTSSDYRLKDNIAPMVGALDTIAQLKPVTYKWKVDGSDGQGFIAHELQEVVPDCVIGEKDAVDADGNPQYQGIDTSFLVATLTAAIQELKAIVDTQAERIAVLEGK